MLQWGVGGMLQCGGGWGGGGMPGCGATQPLCTTRRLWCHVLPAGSRPQAACQQTCCCVEARVRACALMLCMYARARLRVR
jgi:hypothetical protein